MYFLCTPSLMSTKTINMPQRSEVANFAMEKLCNSKPTYQHAINECHSQPYIVPSRQKSHNYKAFVSSSKPSCSIHSHTTVIKPAVFLVIYQLFFVLVIKPTRCTDFPNLFWNGTLHVSDSSSVHHQEFFTVHTAVVYVIQVC